MVIEDFFVASNLMTCIFGTTGSSANGSCPGEKVKIWTFKNYSGTQYPEKTTARDVKNLPPPNC